MNFSRSWSWNLKAAIATVQITLSNPHDGTACTTTATALEEPHQAAQPFDITSEVTQRDKTKQIHRKNTGSAPPAVQISTGWPGAPPPPPIGEITPRLTSRLCKTQRVILHYTWQFELWCQYRGPFLLLSRAGQLPSRIMVDHRIW